MQVLPLAMVTVLRNQFHHIRVSNMASGDLFRIYGCHKQMQPDSRIICWNNTTASGAMQHPLDIYFAKSAYSFVTENI